MGKGALYARSMKQKLNTTSTTESETVGASDCLGQTIWTMNFLEHQGVNVRRNYYYQDNESAMRLERNGIRSASKRSRHIDIRFFFIKDRIEKGDIHLLYCPTEDMLADFFTKPLQGKVFERFRDMVMGRIPVAPVEDPSLAHTPAQERVGSSNLEAATWKPCDGSSAQDSAHKKVSWADVVKKGLLSE
jgi:KUP system potassium uptake protein